MNNWIKYHPGGDKAVYHLVGRDATDEMIAYHSDETQGTFLKWKIGEIDHKWINMRPPIQGGKYRTLEEKGISSPPTACQLDACEEIEDVSLIKNSPKVSRKYMAGEVTATKITPPIEGDMIPSLSTTEAYQRHVIKNPADIITNFDHSLVENDLQNLPALDPQTQEFLSTEYNKLHQQVIDGGYYKCNYWAYGREALRIGALFITSFFLLHFKWYFFSAIAIGFAWQQLVFIAHDAGHISITHNYQADNIIGMTVASWIGGLSLGWWKRNHNVHHLITNDPVHDPDIQHLPFFAVSTRLFGNVYSTYYDKFLWFDRLAQKMIPIQNYLYYPILSFGRFNLYRLSWEHILMGLGPRHGKAAWFRYYELLGLTFFNWWFFYLIVSKTLPDNWTRFMYVMVSHITTMIVHVQITLSHFAMSTSDLGVHESFPSRQIRTTMDVDCPEWFDYFHGGLQFQAIHHLFPRVPRHNFRKLQPLVIGFCEKVGLKYSIYGFVDGNEVVINKLGEIAKQAKILNACTKTMANEAMKEGIIFPELH
jgi:delta8-fatty-acid desaturase